MPPLAIIAATAAVGAGANIASGMANAGAAKSAASSNAATIRANEANNTLLIQDQQRANNDILTGARNTTQDILTQTRGDNLGVADTLDQQARGLYQPTADRGNAAGSAINALLGIGGDAQGQSKAFNDWLGSTGFQFALKTGADAVSSNADTKGLLSSGGTLRALNQVGQQTGQTYFGNYLNGLQGQQSVGLSAANALSGVYGQSAGLRTNANTNFANGMASNFANWGNTLSALNTSSVNNLVSGNTQSTGALVGNTNNALAQTVSSNNAMANGISGLAGNVAGAYGLSQGLSSYAAPNMLATGSPSSVVNTPSVASANGSSYALNTTLPNLRF